MLDILNLTTADLEQPKKTSSFSENEFKPNPNKAKNSIYSARVRPVYWLDQPKKNYIFKSVFYFTEDDGNTTTNPYFESAFSENRQQDDCLAIKTFFKYNNLKKTDARASQIANDIRPKSSYFYLVLVEHDAVNADNIGKLMVYKAPVQVHNIIQGAINLTEEEIAIGKTACNIYHPLEGKSLMMNIGIKDGFWNYNGTVTLSDAQPTKWNGKALTVEDVPAFTEFLQKGNEMMENYKYRPMDDERYNLLLSIISAKTGDKLGGVEAVKQTEINIDGIELEVDSTVETKEVEEKVETKVEDTVIETKSDSGTLSDDELTALINDVSV